MLAQMAATAGSVAVGSTIGHGISSMLFGGRSEAAPAEQQQAASQQNTSSFAPNCEVQAKDFSKCIEKADLQSCSWYLEQLKAVSFCLPVSRFDSYHLISSARQLRLNSMLDSAGPVRDLLLVVCGHFTCPIECHDSLLSTH